jgi:uncharacterized membrane protein
MAALGNCTIIAFLVSSGQAWTVAFAITIAVVAAVFRPRITGGSRSSVAEVAWGKLSIKASLMDTTDPNPIPNPNP